MNKNRLIPRVRLIFTSGAELNIINIDRVCYDEDMIEIFYDVSKTICFDFDDLSQFCVDFIRRDDFHELS